MYAAVLRGRPGSLPLRFVLLYAAYSEQILHDEKRAAAVRELSEKPELLIREDTLSQYISPGDGILGVAAGMQELGLIKTCNAALCELVGYSKEELKELRMLRLIPQLLRPKYGETLEQQCWLMDEAEEEGKELVAVPNYTNGYSFLIRARKVAEQYRVHHLLADVSGLISAVSSSTDLAPSTSSRRHVYLAANGQ